MEQSETLTELAPALAKAQAEMKPAAKDSRNPHFNSKYADLASVWEACRGPLATNGLSVIQTPETEGPTVTVQTMLLHASGQWVRTKLTVTAVKSDPQGIGSAITYARRYGLAAVVGVAPEEDDDGNAASRRENGRRREPAPESQAPEAPASLAPAAEWIAAIGRAKDMAGLLKLWQAMTPDWGRYSDDEQAQIAAAKDEAKERLAAKA
jgi:hypothetical protein